LKELIVQDIARVRLEKETFSSQFVVSNDFKVEILENQQWRDHVVIRMLDSILTLRNEDVLRVPADWWQAFKLEVVQERGWWRYKWSRYPWVRWARRWRENQVNKWLLKNPIRFKEYHCDLYLPRMTAEFPTDKPWLDLAFARWNERAR
jgi:hypothetical protein